MVYRAFCICGGIKLGKIVTVPKKKGAFVLFECTCGIDSIHRFSDGINVLYADDPIEGTLHLPKGVTHGKATGSKLQ